MIVWFDLLIVSVPAPVTVEAVTVIFDTPAGVEAAMVTVKVVVRDGFALFKVTLAGEKEPFAPAGKPETVGVMIMEPLPVDEIVT